MKAIVLAAGAGTRLLPLTRAIPKEMIRVGLKPTIEHCIEVIKAGGIREILVIVGRKKESIIDHLGSGERLGVSIYYRVQEKPLGTALAIQLGKDFIGSDDFVIIYGDNYFKPYESIKDIIAFHKSSDADVTLVIYPVDDPRKFGIVKSDENGKVSGMIEKPTLEEAKPYRVNKKYYSIAGLIIVKNTIFSYIELTKPGKNQETWITDSIALMKEDDKRIKAYLFKGNRFDIGSAESLLEADKLELDSKD